MILSLPLPEEKQIHKGLNVSYNQSTVIDDFIYYVYIYKYVLICSF